jgi:hypothetical protein
MTDENLSSMITMDSTMRLERAPSLPTDLPSGKIITFTFTQDHHLKTHLSTQQSASHSKLRAWSQPSGNNIEDEDLGPISEYIATLKGSANMPKSTKKPLEVIDLDGIDDQTVSIPSEKVITSQSLSDNQSNQNKNKAVTSEVYNDTTDKESDLRKTVSLLLYISRLY